MSGPHRDTLPRNQLLIGDARKRLAELPAGSIDTVITSPPYFALRDYGQPEQLGLEPDIDGWVHTLVTVAREMKRVLKPTGGWWLNVADSYSHHPREGAPKKSLLLGPQRLALALVGDGWVLRNHVIWAKSNPMPSNVTDRLSCTHESIYFFSKQGRYFFDLNAIREPHKSDRVHGKSDGGERVYPPPGVLPRRDERSQDVNGGLGRMKYAGLIGHPLGKNPGDVWAMGTASYHGEHFASFPARLVERPLLATCPERVCAICGRPWQRARQRIDGRWLAIGALKSACSCRADWQPGVVLDPFMGSGTVALVAEQYHRDWVGIELSPEYAALAKERLEAWRAQHSKENLMAQRRAKSMEQPHMYQVPEGGAQTSREARLIRVGIAAADREERELDDQTARLIATRLYVGQNSALYALVSSGAIVEDVYYELTRDYDQETPEVREWIAWLVSYCRFRADKGSVAGWDRLESG